MQVIDCQYTNIAVGLVAEKRYRIHVDFGKINSLMLNELQRGVMNTKRLQRAALLHCFYDVFVQERVVSLPRAEGYHPTADSAWRSRATLSSVGSGAPKDVSCFLRLN